jgi:flagellar protein FlaG
MAITKVEVSGLTDLPPRTSYRAPGTTAVPPSTSTGDGDTQKREPEAKTVPAIEVTSGASLRFSVDQDTGKTVACLVDPRTGEVLRQVPSTEALALAKQLGKSEGLLLDLKV